MSDSQGGARIIPFPGGKSAFFVRIEYREPSYELAMGRKPKAYSWTYRVHGRSREDAERLALTEFQQMARLSDAGWVREIVGISTDRE